MYLVWCVLNLCAFMFVDSKVLDIILHIKVSTHAIYENIDRDTSEGCVHVEHDVRAGIVC